MSEIIERVARAMNDARYGYVADPAVYAPSLDDLAVARAAIEAMREPTEAMLKQSLDCATTDLASDEDFMGNFKDAWQSMIDAALQER